MAFIGRSSPGGTGKTNGYLACLCWDTVYWVGDSWVCQNRDSIVVSISCSLMWPSVWPPPLSSSSWTICCLSSEPPRMTWDVPWACSRHKVGDPWVDLRQSTALGKRLVETALLCTLQITPCICIILFLHFAYIQEPVVFGHLKLQIGIYRHLCTFPDLPRKPPATMLLPAYWTVCLFASMWGHLCSLKKMLCYS